jgi:hypothetical protein
LDEELEEGIAETVGDELDGETVDAGTDADVCTK